MPLNPFLVEAPLRFVSARTLMLHFIDRQDPDTAAAWARECMRSLVSLVDICRVIYADFL
jgi:hypothetical protein